MNQGIVTKEDTDNTSQDEQEAETDHYENLVDDALLSVMGEENDERDEDVEVEEEK